MNLFSPEGKLVEFVTKTGELILLNLVWLLCCIPVITIIPATTSLYYAVIKSIRRDRGNPVKEYFKSFKRCALKGIGIELMFIVWGAVLLLGRRYALASSVGDGLNLLLFLYDFLIAITGLFVLYLIPAFSRFNLKLISLFKITFVMMIRFIYLSVPLLIMVVIAAYVMVRFIPWVLICIFPGIIVYLATFLAEPALIKYTPAPAENEDAWYLPESKK